MRSRPVAVSFLEIKDENDEATNDGEGQESDKKPRRPQVGAFHSPLLCVSVDQYCTEKTEQHSDSDGEVEGQLEHTKIARF